VEPLESIVQEVTAFENQLNRRTFFKLAFSMAVVPDVSLSTNDQEFVRRVTATLIPAEAMNLTQIDVAANLEHILQQGSADHRRKVLRFISWSRRASILYGGEQIAINARGSRFVLVQKTARTLSSLCLISFWGDERALKLIRNVERRA
jgi:hypothetical protein